MIEQNIEVEQDQSEKTIGINREQSVLHGIDGVSPIATVTQTATGATISITDRDGTTTATITNGQDGQNGQDGFSPIATVSKTGDTATITITDKNGTTTASISDGSGSGASITVDDELSSTSTNPVQNRVINSALGLKANSADLKAVATSGSYNDLSNKPTIPSAQVNSDWNANSGVAKILNKPTIPSAGTITSGSTGYATGGDVYNAIGDVETILSTLNNGGGAQ